MTEYIDGLLRSEEYKAFLRQMRCLVCGGFPVEVAHSTKRGASAKTSWGAGPFVGRNVYVPGGGKGSDFFGLPLCHTCHMEQHMHGTMARFLIHKQVIIMPSDIWKIHSVLLVQFIASRA